LNRSANAAALDEVPTSVDDIADEFFLAIRGGDLPALEHLLTDHPRMLSASLGGRYGTRTPLHVATDWPGYFPNGPQVVRMLIASGADPNARPAPDDETPLHWAASSDDVDALDALLAAGADIDAPGAVIGGGTPLDDAVAFGQWAAARRLVERGARVTLWNAAALGLTDRLEAQLDGPAPPSPDELTDAFWCACHGGQRAAAEYLLARGADLHWVGHDGLTALDAARRSGAGALAEWLVQRGAKTADGAAD
jgi:ankyrin repeat protein